MLIRRSSYEYYYFKKTKNIKSNKGCFMKMTKILSLIGLISFVLIGNAWGADSKNQIK